MNELRSICGILSQKILEYVQYFMEIQIQQKKFIRKKEKHQKTQIEKNTASSKYENGIEKLMCIKRIFLEKIN